jgi:hypothetical protein
MTRTAKIHSAKRTHHLPFAPWTVALLAVCFVGRTLAAPDTQYHANNSGMSLLDFEYAQKVRQVFKDGTSDMVSLDAMISSTAGHYNQINDQVTFIDNHDMPRFQGAGASGRPLEQALAFTLTSRGVPATSRSAPAARCRHLPSLPARSPSGNSPRRSRRRRSRMSGR